MRQRDAPSRRRTRRTASASSSTASGRGTSTSTASRPATRSARSAAPGRRRPATPLGDGHASRSCRARTSRTATSPPYADVADASDIEAVIHLGDYIYEGGGQRRACARAGAGDPHARRVPDPPRPVQDRPEPPGRARRASVARHLGRPRVREQLRRPGLRPGRAARGGPRPAGRRVPRLLGAHAAARARASPRGPDLELYRRFRWGKHGDVQRARRAPVPLRPARRLRATTSATGSGYCPARSSRPHDARRRAARVAVRGPRDDQVALERARPADRLRAVQRATGRPCAASSRPRTTGTATSPSAS